MAVTKELVRDVRKLVANNPTVITSQLASALKASEVDVILSLPLSMRLRGRTANIEEIWDFLCGWHNPIINYSRPHSRFSLIPQQFLPISGKHGGMMGISCGTPLAAFDIDFTEIAFIWFVTKPILGKESNSVQFYNKQGEHVISVYVGQDAHGFADAEDKKDFEEMKARFGIIPVPRTRCGGCTNCTCNSTKKCTH